MARALMRRALGRRGTVLARCLERGLPIPRWGNLRRTAPFSQKFGAERGIPVDRYYLEAFLAAHRREITGTVLEIQSPAYATRFGEHVTRVDTIDIDPSFSPTFTCDLARADAVASDHYDCFLLPASLQGLRELDACLREAVRVVRPGGVVLASTAGFVPLMADVPDYWRMSADGWREVAERVWPHCLVEIAAHGNCLSAAAAMLGLSAEELSESELDVVDPRYPVTITMTCRKPR